jgi:hypothetical protein
METTIWRRWQIHSRPRCAPITGPKDTGKLTMAIRIDRYVDCNVYVVGDPNCDLDVVSLGYQGIHLRVTDFVPCSAAIGAFVQAVWSCVRIQHIDMCGISC